MSSVLNLIRLGVPISGGHDQDDPFAGMFTMIVQSDNPGTSGASQFTIPTNGSGYDYVTKAQKVGGGTIDETGGNTGDVTLTFTDGAGQYKVGISGDFPLIIFSNTGDNQKLISIESWGDIVWGNNQSNSFFGCSNLSGIASLSDGHSSVTSLRNFLRNTSLASIDSAFLENAPNVTNLSNFLFGTTLTTESYSNFLVWLEANYNTPAQTFHGGNATYNAAGATARSSLVDTYGWTIADGGSA
ncbi:MAG: hypothetical protein AAGA75_24465 [Cyanobacteria bacterium P01_E01_bin.6]